MTTHEAGRELDALIAEKVMGLHPVQVLAGTSAATTLFVEPGRRLNAWNGAHPRPYSTDIAAAWLVVVEMERRGFSCMIATNACSGGRQNGVKFFEGFRGLGHSIFDADQHAGWDAVDGTVPLAICRAALSAVLPQHTMPIGATP